MCMRMDGKGENTSKFRLPLSNPRAVITRITMSAAQNLNSRAGDQACPVSLKPRRLLHSVPRRPSRFRDWVRLYNCNLQVIKWENIVLYDHILKRAPVPWFTGVGGETRRWDDMDSNLLMSIFKRLSWYEIGFSVCYVCRSWLSAILDLMFPLTDVLDLRPLDFIEVPKCRVKFLHFLTLMFDRRPNTIWKKLFLPVRSVHREALDVIAQRTPSLHYLSFPSRSKIHTYASRVFHYWKNLKEINCCVYHLPNISESIKNICRLTLNGPIADSAAMFLAKNFHQLKYLIIRYCILSPNALTIILDSHKNLLLLDSRHCYCLANKTVESMFKNPRADFSEGPRRVISLLKVRPDKRKEDWNEKVINQKASGIKLHLQCAKGNCPQCLVLHS